MNTEQRATHHSKKTIRLLVAGAGMVVLLIVVLFFGLTHKPDSDLPAATLDSIGPKQPLKSITLGHAFALHPDGETLAFIHFRDKERVLFIQPKGQEVRAIKELGGAWKNIRLAWSPDGQKLICLWRDDSYKISLLTFESETLILAQEQILANDPRYYYGSIDWLDEQTLVLSRSILNEARSHLYKFDLETLEYTLFSGSKFEGDPRFIRLVTAHKGHVAYVQNKNKKRNFHVLNGQGEEYLSYSTELQVFDLTLMPDFSGVLFLSNKGPKLLSLDGSVTSVDLKSEGVFSYPHFTEDGRYLYMVRHVLNHDLWRRPVRPELIEAEPLSLSFANDTQARCRAGSNEFVFVSERSGNQQLWLQSGQQVEQLTDFPHQSELGYIHLSSDKNLVVFKSDHNVLLYDLTSGEVKTLFVDTPRILPLGFDKKQQYLFYSYNYITTNPYDIDYWRHNLTTGQNEKLAIAPGRQAMVSAGELYYIDTKDYGLYKWTAEGARPMQGTFQRDTLFLAENGETLFYTLPRANQRRRVWAYNKTTQRHKMAMQKDQYSGQITDICDDGMALIQLDQALRLDIFKVAVRPYLNRDAQQ